MSQGDPLRVLAVCGVGMGSSLILRMNAEEVLSNLGVAAQVEATDLSSARSTSADVIIGQGLHTGELQDAAPIVITITNFMDKDALRAQLADRLRETGWLSEPL